MRKILQAVLILPFLLMILAPAGVHAQSPLSQGMSITPPVFELSANPGDTITNSIRVDNITDNPLQVFTAADNFTAIGEEGQVGLTKEESSFSLASWIAISPTNFTIPGKSSKTFSFTIKIPKNAEPGGRFGSVVFSTDPKKPAEGSGIGTGQEVGSLLLLKIAGDVKEQASIETFKAIRNVFERGPIAFETRVQNEGNVHVKPTGTITISDIFGHKVASIPANSQNVLPDAVRRMDSTWTNTGSFGKYTATLSLQYGDSGATTTASTTFFIIPWRVILAWALGIGILITLLYFARRRFARALRILFGKE